jgi:hypothetical protein
MNDHLRDTGLRIRDILGSCGPMDLWQLQSLLGCSRDETRLALACLTAQRAVCPFQLEERLCFRLEGAPDPSAAIPEHSRRPRGARSSRTVPVTAAQH